VTFCAHKTNSLVRRRTHTQSQCTASPACLRFCRFGCPQPPWPSFRTCRASRPTPRCCSCATRASLKFRQERLPASRPCRPCRWRSFPAMAALSWSQLMLHHAPQGPVWERHHDTGRRRFLRPVEPRHSVSRSFHVTCRLPNALTSCTNRNLDNNQLTGLSVGLFQGLTNLRSL
jgi:hypothetical protein